MGRIKSIAPSTKTDAGSMAGFFDGKEVPKAQPLEPLKNAQATEKAIYTKEQARAGKARIV
jgi:hypothetical protein